MPIEFDDNNDDGVADEVESGGAPEWVGDADDDDIEIEGEDISQAEGGGVDWINPAKDVVFEITHASINTYTPDNSDWTKRSLKLYLKVDKGGIDGKGTYAGKIFFPNSKANINGLLVTVNRDAHDFTVNAQGKPTDWYKAGSGGAFADYKEFLLALGFPVAPTPKVNKVFLAGLIGHKVMANITRKNRQVKDGGKYVDVTDEYENEIVKYRAVKVAAVVVAETAAV